MNGGAIASALGLVGLVSCSVALDDPAGRACDDAHACAQGRVCRGGVCVSPLAEDGGNDGAVGGDAGGEAGANLDAIGSFESGCAPWQPFQGTAAPSDVAHSGSGSCEACGGDQRDFTLDDKGFLAHPPPGRYTARVWIRAAPGGPAPSLYGVILRTIDTSPTASQYEIEKNTATAVVSSDWTQTTVSLDVTKPAEALNVVVFAQTTSQPPGCMLVDDVTVERAP